jgi:mRNA interferase MazF
MRRGNIWSVAGGKDYSGQPRPVVIVQDDSFDATASITICAFTTDETEAPLFRLPVEPNDRNGLPATGRLMVLRLNQAILILLGLATSPRTRLEV